MRAYYKSCLSKRNHSITLILNAKKKKVIEIANRTRNDVPVYITTDVFQSTKEAFAKYNDRIHHLYGWGYDYSKDQQKDLI